MRGSLLAGLVAACVVALGAPSVSADSRVESKFQRARLLGAAEALERASVCYHKVRFAIAVNQSLQQGKTQAEVLRMVEEAGPEGVEDAVEVGLRIQHQGDRQLDDFYDNCIQEQKVKLGN